MPQVVVAVGAGLAAIGGAAAAAAAAGTFLGITAVGWAAISVGISIGGSLLAPKPKVPQNSSQNIDRLRASIDPRTPRKTAIGTTALATDIRDEEFTDNQEYFHRFIVCASHTVESIDEIWFDDKLAWTLAGGVQGDFVGYLTVNAIPLGNTAFNISSRMGDSRKYTGLANVKLKYKLTGNSKKVDSPFAQSITTRITIRGKGAKLYDPRLDSTVAGGSGSQRADDQSTWAWDDDACRNPALALLFYLLGWRIRNITLDEWLLAVGKGIPKERIDLESFAIAANICDETVSLDGGGTEPRYRCDGVWSEGDSPTTVIDMLKACMNADLDDVDGKLRLTIFRDDIAEVEADFTDDDIVGEFEWQPYPPLNETFNVVRGVYTDPSDASLYQPVDYPQVEETSPDDIDRIYTLNLPMVESVTQARRLAALKLGRQSYPGRFTAVFQATAWRVQKNSIVRLTFAPRGWTNKVFRVAEYEARVDGRVPMVLVEEDPDIYVEPPAAIAVSPVDASAFDPFLDPIVAQLLNINADGLDARLDPAIVHVPAGLSGSISSYANATGSFIIKTGDGTDISSNFTLSTPTGGNPDGLTVGYVSQAFSVTGGIASTSDEDQTSLVIQATGSGAYSGVLIQRRLTIVKDYPPVLVPFVANANDQNGLTPDTPGGTLSLSHEVLDSGNVIIKGTVTFTASSDPSNKNSIDGFEIGVYSADTNDGHTMTGTASGEDWFYVISDLGESSHEFVFASDVAANRFYKVGVRAVRGVGFNVDPTGFIKSGIKVNSGMYQPETDQNYTGQIGGVEAPDIADAAENVNADNDGNGLTPDAPTSVSVASTTYPDSTAAVGVSFTFTESSDPAHKNSIDGYYVGLRIGDTSAGYTYNSADNNTIRWQYLRPGVKRANWNGMPSAKWYTGIVIPYRKVRTNIEVDGEVLGNVGQSSSTTPHRPSSVVNFTGSIDSETATNIKTWAGYANTGLNSDGTIKAGKVDDPSALVAGIINEADWEAQAGTISLAASDSEASTFLTVESTGTRLRVEFILDYQITCTDPDEGDEFELHVELWAERVSNGADYFSSDVGELGGVFTLSEVWNQANDTGNKSFSRSLAAFRHDFDGLPTGDFNIGYRITTPSTNGAVCRAYRYIRADDMRAAQ